MGRNSFSYRKVLEYSAGISIQDLINYGLLNKGNLTANWNYTITQTSRFNTDKLADVKMTVKINDDNRYIQFEYNYKGQDYNFKQPIIRQSVNYGGYRYFFRCDCTKNGRYCGRRVKALYFGGNVYACRHCLELVYQNCRYNRDIIRYKNNAEILQKKADKLRRYGHPRKANTLQRKSIDYEIQHDDAFAYVMINRFGHLLTPSQRRCYENY